MDINEAQEKFFQKILNNEGSKRTVELYKRSLSEFFSIAKVEKAELLTKKHLTDFKNYVENLQGISTKTKNLKLIPLRSFLRFMADTGIHSLDGGAILSPFRIRNGNNKKLDLISREELKTFLSYKENPRDDLIVNILYATGLRVAEMAALSLKDVSEKFQITGKGGKQRYVFVDEKTMGMFEAYKKSRDDKDGPLFTGKYGEQLMTTTIQKIVRERGEKLLKLNGRKITPHVLRHLFATHLYENGADIYVLKEMLGHSSLNTTAIYTHVSTDRMSDSYKKFHCN